jgi:hypothetical protein
MGINVNQSSFAGGELAPPLWGRTDLAKYAVGAKELKNFTVQPHGGIVKRSGTRFVYEVVNSANKSRLIPFQFSPSQSYILEFGNKIMRVIKDGGLVLNPVDSSLVSVATEYSFDELSELKFTQSADVMIFTHPKHPPRKLSRTDHHVWVWEDITFSPKVTSPSYLTLTPSEASATGKTYYYKVTAIDKETGEESLPREANRVNDNTLSDTNYMSLSWPAVTGCDRYHVYRKENGVFGWIATVEGTSLRDEGISPDNSITPPSARNPFEGDDKFPSCVNIYEQRLCFGASNLEPETLYTSQTGHYFNMSVSSPMLDTDAITGTVAGGGDNKVNRIRSLVSLNELLILTSGGVWKLSSGGDALTHATARFKRQTSLGVSSLSPLVIDDTILYVMDKGGRVRSLGYTLEADKYKGNELSILASHLFEGFDIVSWCYQSLPDSIVWAVRNDGKLLSMTFLPEHDVFAWTHHETDGEFEDVACISENGKDVVYFIVKREINGVTKRYIEKLEPKFVVQDMNDAFFIDCGLTYDGVEVHEITGLEHLEAKSLVALADGNVIKDLIVIDGKITLPNNYSKVQIGLAYEAKLRTLNVDYPLQNGSSQGQKKRINKARLFVERSKGAQISSTGKDGSFTPLKYNDVVKYDEPPDLYTGWTFSTIKGTYDVNGEFYLKTSEPLPMKVNTIIPEVSHGG